MRHRSAVFLLTLPWLACTCLAAEPPGIAPGDKLRIRLERGTALGTLEAWDERTLTLKDLTTAERATYSLDELRGVEVSRGRQSRGHCAGRGALIGGAIGAASGVALTTPCDGNTEGCGGAWIPLAGGVFGAAGALLGALVGAAVTPGEAWRPVKTKQFHAFVTPVRGGAQVRVAVTF
jgi:hypothetical protein